MAIYWNFTKLRMALLLKFNDVYVMTGSFGPSQLATCNSQLATFHYKRMD